MRSFLLRLACAAVLAAAILVASARCEAPAGEPRFEVLETEAGLEVREAGELVAVYVTEGGAKPTLFPLVGPGGLEMTRGWPMREATAEEAADHPHHRSVWLGHGDVNGTDFWLEQGEHGEVVTHELGRMVDGETATITAHSRWNSPQGGTLLEEVRTMTFGSEGGNEEAAMRWIDFGFTLTAELHPVTFGDTKEGTFGLRVPGWLKVEAEGGGTITNSEGQQDEAAWGQPADWVDYGGTHEGEPVGVLVMNHPASFGYPTRWHVRTYGLFAANPFGQRGFDSSAAEGGYTLPAGESLRLRYRVLLYRGAMTAERAAAQWQAFAGDE